MFALLKAKKVKGNRAGVVLTDRELAIAVVHRRAGQKPLLQHCAFHPAESSGIDHAIAAAVDTLRLSREPLSAVIGSDDYQLVQVEAPEVLPSELHAALRWRLREMISFHIDDATIDVFEIPNQSRRTQGKITFAVAARNEAVKKLAGLFAAKARGFDVIDIPELCLRNLSSLLPQDEKGVALLVLGDHFAQLVLTREGMLYLARRIELARRMDINFDESAEALDIDAGALALELQRSLDYYENQYDQPPIGDLAIAPADARSEQLAVALRNESSLRISQFDLKELLEIPAEVTVETRWPALLAVGAALRVDAMEL